MLLISAPATAPPQNPRVLEQELLQIAAGDKTALALFYEQTHAAVYGFALSILKHAPDAQDALQETYLRAWDAAGRYRAQGKPMAWLLTITRNLAMDRLRERQRQPTPAQDDMPAQEAWPQLDAENRLLLQQLLATLGDEERQILMLHSLTGLRHREIAALLSMPLSTVLSKYSRAVKRLRQALQNEM